MKKIIVTTVLLCSAISFAQKIKFGAKIGLNISSFRGNYPAEVDETNSKLGFHFGGLIEYKINEKFSIQPELLLSTQSGSTEIRDDYYYFTFPATYNYKSFTQTNKLTYLNLPLMIKYKVIKKLSIEVGPQIGYLLSAKSEWKHVNSIDASENTTIDINLLETGTYILGGTSYQVKDKANRFDFGINLGTSYYITKSVFLQARYNIGLSAIDNSTPTATSSDSWDLKNSVFQFSIGSQF